MAILDIASIERELAVDALESLGDLVWLDESYHNPATFWEALVQAQKKLSSWGVKSIPLKCYDFYHDIVIRNQENNAPAFRWYDSILGWKEISYFELGYLAGEKAANWISSGVQPHQILCVMYPVGQNCVVSLLAALKIGVTLSFLPPMGKCFVQKRLQALNPDHIVTDEIYVSLLGKWQKCLLVDNESDKKETQIEHSYTYPSGAIIALCFDPCSETSHIPKEVTSDAAYLCPLRDGMIALGIKPNYVCAASGFHVLETQPALLLACLLNGGTYLHIELDDIVKNPLLLTKYPVKAMGVSNQLRNILLNKPIKIGKQWNFWFRNPAESHDIDQWQKFIRLLHLQDVHAGNLKWDAALCGCSLFSAKQKGQAHLRALPSAGVPWSLASISNGDVEAVGDYGVFSATMLGHKEKEKIITTNMLAKERKEWLFVGSHVSGRAGRYYSQSEILEIICDIPHCAHSTIVEVPIFGVKTDPVFTLLIFIGTRNNIDESATIKKIHDTIIQEMGNEFIIDKVKFFLLYPRHCLDGSMDHHWCCSQYLTGGLFQKERDEIYRCITRLRECVIDA